MDAGLLLVVFVAATLALFLWDDGGPGSTA